MNAQAPQFQPFITSCPKTKAWLAKIPKSPGQTYNQFNQPVHLVAVMLGLFTTNSCVLESQVINVSKLWTSDPCPNSVQAQQAETFPVRQSLQNLGIQSRTKNTFDAAPWPPGFPEQEGPLNNEPQERSEHQYSLELPSNSLSHEAFILIRFYFTFPFEIFYQTGRAGILLRIYSFRPQLWKSIVFSNSGCLSYSARFFWKFANSSLLPQSKGESFEMSKLTSFRASSSILVVGCISNNKMIFYFCISKQTKFDFLLLEMSFFKNIIQSIAGQSIKGYEMDKESIGFGGSLQLWKIYNATKNDKGKKVLGTVFLYEFKDQKSSDKLTLLKKEYSSLSRLRHPAILIVQEPLVEEKQYIAYVTERIECSLVTALEKPQLYNELCSSDIELKMHILELIEGLQFLHNDVKLAHLDFSPNNIYITQSGRWKIAGSSYSQQIINKNQLVECPQINFSQINKPQMQFSAPELMETVSKCTIQSDIFSLGMLLLRLFKQKNDKIPFPQFQTTKEYLNFVSRLQYELTSPPYTQFYSLQLLQLITYMLSMSAAQRPTLTQFQQHDWFNDYYLHAFNLMNKIQELDQTQQVTFLRGFTGIVFEYEEGLLRKRIIPQLLELTRFDYLIPPIIQIILEALKRELIQKKFFIDDVWPRIKQLSSAKEIPAQALYDLVMNIQFLHKFISMDELKDSILPLQMKCFECKVPKLQDIAIRVSDYIVKNIDYNYSKTKLLPKILACVIDKQVEIRRIALVCLYNILDILDRQTLNEQVLVTLEKVKQGLTTPQINQITLKIYNQISKTLPADFVAQKLVPQMIPYLTDNSLSKEEFDQYYDTLLSFLKRIQEEKHKLCDTVGVMPLQPVDLTLSLPENKRLVSESQNKFEFLNLFGVAKKQEVSVPYQPDNSQDWDFEIQKNQKLPAQQQLQANPPEQQQPQQQLNIKQPPPIQQQVPNLQQSKQIAFQPQQSQIQQQPIIQQQSQFQPYTSQSQQSKEPKQNIVQQQSNSLNDIVIAPQPISGLNALDFFNQHLNVQKEPINVQNQQQADPFSNVFNQPNQQEQKKLSNRPLFNNPLTKIDESNDPFSNLKPINKNSIAQQNDPFNQMSFNQVVQPKQINQNYDQQKPNVQQPAIPKGNMLNLNYDPFAELSSSNQTNWGNPSFGQPQQSQKQPQPQSNSKNQTSNFDLI